MEDAFKSLSEQIKNLKEQGYTLDFNDWEANGSPDYMKNDTGESMKVVDFWRFEGASDPGNNTILFAVETSDGKKGVLLDAYGAYASESKVPDELIKSLYIQRNEIKRPEK